MYSESLDREDNRDGGTSWEGIGSASRRDADTANPAVLPLVADSRPGYRPRPLLMLPVNPKQRSPVLFQNTVLDLSTAREIDAKLNRKLGGEVNFYFWLF